MKNLQKIRNLIAKKLGDDFDEDTAERIENELIELYVLQQSDYEDTIEDLISLED